MKVEELEKSFKGVGEVKDFDFVQIEISDFGYLYGVNSHYEVFERKLTPVCLDFQKKIFSETEFKVRYPKSKDFGVWAWTFPTLEKALKKFNNLKN